VYIPIPTQDFLLVTSSSHASQQQHPSFKPQHRQLSEQDKVMERLNRTVLHQKSLLERVRAPNLNELSVILQRLDGRISARKLETLLGPTEMSQLLASVVEDYKSKHARIDIPPIVDLFVVESLFRGGKLAQAMEKLWSHSTQAPVAWGNTNTIPRDYKDALEMAWHQKRPVAFCVFEPVDNEPVTGLSYPCALQSPALQPSRLFDLQVDSFRTLLERSIERLVQTGRYIPAQAIWDMHERWKQTLQGIETKLLRQQRQDEADAGDHIVIRLGGDEETEEGDGIRKRFPLINKLSRFEFHRHLVNIAGYEMDDSHCVRPLVTTSANVARPVASKGVQVALNGVLAPARPAQTVRDDHPQRKSGTSQRTNGKVNQVGVSLIARHQSPGLFNGSSMNGDTRTGSKDIDVSDKLTQTLSDLEVSSRDDTV
jgi:hypothetical protein